jgi:hypothetical protein
MNSHRAPLDLDPADPRIKTTVSAVFGKPESFVRIAMRIDNSGGAVATMTLSQEAADQLARAILIASCAAKAMDMK